MTELPSIRPRHLDCIYYAVAIFFALYLFTITGPSAGGPTLLAMTLIPITYVLFTLQALRDERSLSRACRRRANYVIARSTSRSRSTVSYYMNTEYVALGTERPGMWDHADLIVGGG